MRPRVRSWLTFPLVVTVAKLVQFELALGLDYHLRIKADGSFSNTISLLTPRVLGQHVIVELREEDEVCYDSCTHHFFLRVCAM